MKSYHINYIFLIILLGTSLKSQTCLNGTNFITRQSHLDSLKILYPDCKEIEGQIIMGGPGISNFEGMLQFEKINDLQLHVGESVEDLSGFNSLQEVGILWFWSGPNLIDLTGLNNLKKVTQNLYIRNMNNLLNLSGLDNLEYVASLSIENNGGLISTEGMYNLKKIDYLYISENPELLAVEGFSQLDTISTLMQIHLNPKLTHLDGLENLKYVGDLKIRSNILLSSVDALNGITYIKSNFDVFGNKALEYMPEFDSLKFVGGNLHILGDNPPGPQPPTDYSLKKVPLFPSLTYVGNELAIRAIYSITEFYSFPKLKELNRLSVSLFNLLSFDAFNELELVKVNLTLNNNNRLKVLKGFRNLREVTGDISMRNFDLEEIIGFDKLEKAGEISMTSNGQLKELTCFKNVKSMRNGIFLRLNSNLEVIDFSSLESIVHPNSTAELDITDARKLKSLATFSNLKKLTGVLTVKNNWVLESLSGLDNIDYRDIKTIILSGNSSANYTIGLSDCSIKSICDHLLIGNGGFSTLRYNLPGCNTTSEIREKCLVSTDDVENQLRASINIFPNPAQDRISVTTQNGEVIKHLAITTIDGVVLDVGSANTDNSLDISTLPNGIYILFCTIDGTRVNKPFVKSI